MSEGQPNKDEPRRVLDTLAWFPLNQIPWCSLVRASFLALSMQKHLDDLSREAGVTPEWKELLRDLDRLQQVRIAHRGADWLVRTDASPNVAALFRTAHVALPPRARQTAPPKAAPRSKSPNKRRGRPRRSATPSQISPQST